MKYLTIDEKGWREKDRSALAVIPSKRVKDPSRIHTSTRQGPPGLPGPKWKDGPSIEFMANPIGQWARLPLDRHRSRCHAVSCSGSQTCHALLIALDGL